MVSTVVEGGDQFKAASQSRPPDFVVRESVAAIDLGWVTYAPVANRAHVLQLTVGDDALANVTQGFLKMADGILLQDERLQNSVKGEEVTAAADFAFKAGEGFHSRFGLAQSFQRGAELVVASNLSSQASADRGTVHPTLHF